MDEDDEDPNHCQFGPSVVGSSSGASDGIGLVDRKQLNKNAVKKRDIYRSHAESSVISNPIEEIKKGTMKKAGVLNWRAVETEQDDEVLMEGQYDVWNVPDHPQKDSMFDDDL